MLDEAVGQLIRPSYLGFALGGAWEVLLPPRLKPRTVLFETRRGSRLRLLMGKRVIGRYDGRLRQWHIYRPFRLFVDGRSLPDIEGIETRRFE